MSRTKNKIITIFENYGSILDSPIISSNGKKRNFDLTRDILEKKIEIKYLLKKKIGGEKLYRPQDRKPTPLLKFEDGLRKIFFFYNGLIYDKSEVFRKGFNMEFHKKKKKNIEKNHGNSLTNYHIKNNDEKNINFKESKSKNKEINDEDNNENYIKSEENYDINKHNLTSRNNLFNNNENQKLNNEEKFLSPSSIHHKSYMKSLDNYNNSTQRDTNKSNSESLKKFIPKIKIPSLKLNNLNNDYYKTLNFKNTGFLKTFSSRSTSSPRNIIIKNNNSYTDKDKLFIKEEKEKAKTIQHKMDIINKKQYKLENKLFKIIDRAKYLKPLSIEFKRDAEAIMDKKLKKKKAKGNIKKEVYAMRIENSYAHMRKGKREMIEISDNFVRINDNVFNYFGKDIKEKYSKKTKTKKVDEDFIKNKKKKEKEMRIKFNQNNIKMEKLRYNLFYSLANVRENILHGYSD